MKIALLTSSYLVNGIADDSLLLTALMSRNHSAQYCVWDDRSVDWSQYDLALLRTTWDYHRRFEEFADRLEHIESQCRLLNPAEVVRWNIRKSYLAELAAHDCPIVPTLFAENESQALDAINKVAAQSLRFVIKPEISAGSDLTFLLSQGDVCLPEVRSILARGKMLVQPFISSVAREGEASLLFVHNGNWQFSHAVIKRPKDGDYRVQQEFGGSTELWEPPPEVVAETARALEHIPRGCIYARVDILNPTSTPLIGEIELVEPELFFRHRPAFATDLVVALEAYSKNP